MRAMYEVIYLANHPESEDNPYKPTENNDGTLTYSFNTFTAFNGIIITGSCTADAGKDILSADIIYIQPNMEDYESFTMNQKADNTATISFGDEDPISIDREKLPRQLTVEKGDIFSSIGFGISTGGGKVSDLISRAVTEAIQKGMSVLDGYEIESATLSGKITEEEEYIIADITSFTVADEEGKLWGNQMLMIYKDPDQNSSSIPFGTINYEDYCPKDASAHFSQEEISTITKGHRTIDIDTLTVYHEYEAKINNKIHTLSYTSNSHSENSFEIYYDLMIDGQPFVWKEMETETSDDMEVIQQA